MVHIYCGDGKGKTTAAVGLTVRMAGSGGEVVFGQFFKDGSSSEICLLKTLPRVMVLHCKTVPGRFFRYTEAEKAQAARDYTAYLETLLTAAEGKSLLVLDEAVSACNHGMIPQQRVAAFCRAWGREMEIVLTGRNPSAELLACADYVTEMKKLRHPFDEGLPARRGVEL